MSHKRKWLTIDHSRKSGSFKKPKMLRSIWNRDDSDEETNNIPVPHAAAQNFNRQMSDNHGGRRVIICQPPPNVDGPRNVEPRGVIIRQPPPNVHGPRNVEPRRGIIHQPPPNVDGPRVQANGDTRRRGQPKQSHYRNPVSESRIPNATHHDLVQTPNSRPVSGPRQKKYPVANNFQSTPNNRSNPAAMSGTREERFRNPSSGTQPEEVIQYASSHELPPSFLNPRVEKGNTRNRRNECKFDARNANQKNQQSNNGEMSSATKQKHYNMTFASLVDLAAEEESKILFTLSDNQNNFAELLNQMDTRRQDTMPYLLIIIGKAIASPHRGIVDSLVSLISSKQDFLFRSVSTYMIYLANMKIEQHHIDSLFKLTEFLNYFQQCMPASSSHVIAVLLSVLKDTCNEVFENESEMKNQLTEKIAQIDFQKKNYMKEHTKDEIVQTSKIETLNLKQPPENFRELTVLPSFDDVWQHEPFLRPNLIEGKYSDVDHYLDVQFRLLREDYIRPLREGVSRYVRWKQQGLAMRHNLSCKVYENVYIMGYDFAFGGILHNATFDVSKFRRVNWEYSKRFLTGSLVCLSSDDFQTFYFASVARRDARELSAGILKLKFEDLSEAVLQITPLQPFTVLETEAYFEAYRHNLSALHLLGTDNLPLKQYIVTMETNIQPPKYLSPRSTYDMDSVLSRVNSEISDDLFSRPKQVTVLNDSQWPSNKEFGLDESQYKALKAAITREFAIIQGPPGTGKTYVGLQIVQLLLKNKNIVDRASSSPILIVCYTNHALDQFLQGMLYFTKKIVRIGGKSSNPLLANFQLNTLKKTMHEGRRVPRHIFNLTKQQKFLLQDYNRELKRYQDQINVTAAEVLSEDVLTSHIKTEHYVSLKSYDMLSKQEPANNNYVIRDWLGVHFSDANGQPVVAFDQTATSQSKVPNPPTMSDGNNPNVPEAAEMYLEEPEGEVDVEVVENQRQIDNEEWNLMVDPHDNAQVDAKLLSEIMVPETEWKVQGGKKAIRKYISSHLHDFSMMSEQEAGVIYNVWELNINDRWRLYKLWRQKHVQSLQESMVGLQQNLKTEYQKFNEMRNEEDLHILRDAEIVGMTTTGAAKYRNIVQELNPKVVVIEEAAEILEAHVVTSLARGTEHLILIGDHQQLRPSPTVYELATRFNLDISLFERMIKNGMEYHQLTMQHRMRPEIASLLVPHIYPNLINHESVQSFENIKGFKKNIFFLSHSIMESQEFDSSSKVNQHEAQFLVRLCKHLLLQGYLSSQITILTTYSAQLFALRKLAKGSIDGVRITVVDNFQGEENDIILISFVRSNSENNIGFLKISNRVCVALSRAKKGLFCIGNFELLAEQSPLWKNITESLNKMEAIGQSLSLVCQNHDDVTEVAVASDFDKVPEGGCKKPCEYRLECGHSCVRLCHAYDASHENITCYKECMKILCIDGHKCTRKCYEKCGPCQALVKKTLPRCNHTVPASCYLKAHEIECSVPCEKILPCSHKCGKKCGEDCFKKPCCETVEVLLKCGHKINLKCYEAASPDNFQKMCKVTCGAILKCGHICTGNCGKCLQGRLHLACKKKCSRILVCGHVCGSKCSNTCPPCKEKCENRCSHSKCPSPCGLPCKICTEPCQFSCEHSKCTEICGQLCNREPCCEPCPKLLKCKHRCIGLCGEPCPTLCAVCDPEKVQEIFFGTEDEEGAQFVQLSDCKHIFEMKGLKNWMECEEKNSSEIQMKGCPKCKTVIRTKVLFGNIIKTSLAKIEKVKLKVFGEMKENASKQKVLVKNVMKLNKKYPQKPVLPLQSYITRNNKLGNQQIVQFQNITIVAEEFLFSESKINQYDVTSISSGNTAIDQSTRELAKFTRQTGDLIFRFIQDEFLNVAEQQMDEIVLELQRYKFLCKLIEVLQERPDFTKVQARFVMLVEMACKLRPFRLEDEEMCKEEFKKLIQEIGGAVINVSNEEKTMILKTMSLNKGHWYQCPNGHVYCITECGGATLEGKCNECGASIGGRDHALRTDNRVATAMDGARHSAWSTAGDLGNYEGF